MDELPQAGGAAEVRRGDPGLRGALRGIGGLKPVPVEGGPSMSDITGQLSVKAGHSEDTWVWEISLTNPRPGDLPSP